MADSHGIDCPFCQCVPDQRVVAEHGMVFAILDKYPVTEGHYLIVPKRHVVDYFEMSDVERSDAEALLLLLKDKILEDDSTVQGFNVGARDTQNRVSLLSVPM